MFMYQGMSDVIKAKWNRVREFINELDAEQFLKYLLNTLMYGRHKTGIKKKRQQEVNKEIVKRLKIKENHQQKKKTAGIDKRLKELAINSLESIYLS